VGSAAAGGRPPSWAAGGIGRRGLPTAGRRRSGAGAEPKNTGVMWPFPGTIWRGRTGLEASVTSMAALSSILGLLVRVEVGDDGVGVGGGWPAGCSFECRLERQELLAAQVDHALETGCPSRRAQLERERGSSASLGANLVEEFRTGSWALAGPSLLIRVTIGMSRAGGRPRTAFRVWGSITLGRVQHHDRGRRRRFRGAVGVFRESPSWAGVCPSRVEHQAGGGSKRHHAGADRDAAARARSSSSL